MNSIWKVKYVIKQELNLKPIKLTKWPLNGEMKSLCVLCTVPVDIHRLQECEVLKLPAGPLIPHTQIPS